MKALRVKAFQETACYTKPFANKVTETYPLPPYATVKGMLHAVLKADQLIPFSLSIQGDYESMMIDYRKTYFFEKNKFNIPIIMAGLAIDTPQLSHMTSMPLYTHILYNVNLVFHIMAEDTILDRLYEAFKQYDAHLSLGRQEDLLRVDEVQWVKLDTPDLFEGVSLKNSMFIPASATEENARSEGIPYQLNWTYTVKNGLRQWKRIPSVYFKKHTIVNDEFFCNPVYIDPDGYLIIWNESLKKLS